MIYERINWMGHVEPTVFLVQPNKHYLRRTLDSPLCRVTAH